MGNGINRENASIEEIERAMDCAPTKKIFIRLQAIAFLHREEDWELVLQLARVGAHHSLHICVHPWSISGSNSQIFFWVSGPFLINQSLT
jgi:hypothetical protein